MAASVNGTAHMITAMVEVPEDRPAWLSTLKAIRALPERRTRGRRFF